MSAKVKEFHVLDPITMEQVRKSHVGGIEPKDALILHVREIIDYGKLGYELGLRCHVEIWFPTRDPEIINVRGTLYPTWGEFAATLSFRRDNDGYGLVTLLPVR